jgi:hypothetical protein
VKNTDIPIALLGPAVVGFVVGLEHTPVAAARTAMALPAIGAVVAALMLPALYIGTSLVGEAPRARALAGAALHAAQSCGHALLGMAIPLAFLLATTRSTATASWIGAATLAMGAWCGLRVLRDDAIGSDPEPRSWWIYAVWSLTALGIGARLYAGAVPGGLS